MTSTQTPPPLPTVEEPEGHKSKAFPLRVVIVIIAAMVVGGIIYGVSEAAFSGETTARGSVGTGTVVLTNNTTGSTLINIAGLTGGDTTTSCLVVDYQGTIVPAPINLFGASAGVNTLDPFLDLTVETGTKPTNTAGDTTCGDFTPGVVIFNATTPSATAGTVQAFLAKYHDFATSLYTGWSANAQFDKKAFRFTFHVKDDNAAQGKTSSPVFTWKTEPASVPTTVTTLAP